MGPRQFHQRESTPTATDAAGLCPPPLKINKDSHFIKKSSSSSPSPSSASSTLGIATYSKQQHRHPVIIYTHSPKVIHTNPKDFMALVHKLTGLSRGDDDQSPPQNKSDDGGGFVMDDQESKCIEIYGSNNDNESGSSVITTEENCDRQVNSCLLTPIFDPPPPQFLTNMPIFVPNTAEFFCSNRPFYNYGDSIFYSQMRSSLSSSSLLGFDAINEFRDY